MPKNDSNKQDQAMPKQEKQTKEKKFKMPKSCPINGMCSKLSRKQKTIVIISILIAAAVIISLIVAGFSEDKTKIHTPVISRTEINKKPSIKIEVFEEQEAEQDIIQAQPEPENTSSLIDTIKESQKEETKKTKENADEVKPLDESDSKKLADLSAQVNSLDISVQALQSLSNDPSKIEDLQKRMSKLETLEGNVGKLANIFLAQQLVLLDNAFKVGGNQNIAIKNIQEFAATKTDNKKVAEKLNNLLTLTQEQAIVTPQALLFYAGKLEHIKLQAPKVDDEKAAPTTFMGKVKAMLKSFITVRKNDEITKDKKLWVESMKSLEESIIFADYVTTQKILDNKKLQELGGEDFANFAKLFNTYLAQQQALQAVLGAFIEGYQYDY